MKQVEYKIITTDGKNGVFSGGKINFKPLQRAMSDAGREGWELVAALDTNAHQGRTRHVTVYFQRTADQDAPMKRFEYMIVTAEAGSIFKSGKVDFQAIHDSINDLGDEGWELVTAMDTNAHEGRTRDVVMFFKRERQ